MKIAPALFLLMTYVPAPLMFPDAGEIVMALVAASPVPSTTVKTCLVAATGRVTATAAGTVSAVTITQSVVADTVTGVAVARLTANFWIVVDWAESPSALRKFEREDQFKSPAPGIE